MGFTKLLRFYPNFIAMMLLHHQREIKYFLSVLIKLSPAKITKNLQTS